MSINARETAAWLRVIKTREKARVDQLADWLEKGQEVTLAECATIELFGEIAKRCDAAVLVMQGDINGDEKVAITRAGPLTNCVGLMEIARANVLAAVGKKKTYRFDE